MYKGWIILDKESDKDIVEECGLILKDKTGDNTYNCEVTEESFRKLDKYWGRIYWGLEEC